MNCNSNLSCGFGGNNFWWIILLVLIFCSGNLGGCGYSGGCDNNCCC